MIDHEGKLAIKIGPAFDPLIEPIRYKAAYGGRAEGKA
jgi:hypothetical protein